MGNSPPSSDPEVVNCINFSLNFPTIRFPIRHSAARFRTLASFLRFGAEFQELGFCSDFPTLKRGEPAASAKEFRALADAIREDTCLSTLTCDGDFDPGFVQVLAAAIFSRGLEEVTFISIGPKVVSSELLAAALRSNKSLRHLIIRGVKAGTDISPIFKLLRGHPSLEVVECEDISACDSMGELIVSLPSLRNVKVLNVKIIQKSFCAEVDRVKTLRKLMLWSDKLGDEWIEEFCGTKKARMLRKLQLQCNKFGVKGARDIAQRVLLGNRVIRCLDLGHNNIGNPGATLIVNAIPQSLTTLKLGGCGLDARMGKVLSKLIWQLSLIDLSSNQLCDEGVADLLAAGQDPTRKTCLVKLAISSVGLTERSGKIVAAWLSSQEVWPLQVLELGGNKLGSGGAAQVVDAIKGNERLRMRELGMEHNEIKEAAEDAILGLIERPGAVQSIRLQNNYIGSKAEERLKAAAEKAGVEFTYFHWLSPF